MKKRILILTSICSLTLMSFTTNPPTIRYYKTTCADGSVYYHSCECGLSAASDIGRLICRMPVSE